MAKRKKKKSKATKTDWGQVLIQAAIDFTIGFLLLIIDKIIN